MVLKVKEPQHSEFRFLRRDLVLFTYLHLAAEPALARELLRRGTAALGYETVQLEDQSLPLLAPMSEVAGRLAVQVGGWCMEAQNGGCGVLLSGASGVRPGRVAVLGGGIAGANAARVAAGVGAEVTILDVNPTRLRYLGDLLGGRVTTLMSNRVTLEEEVINADLVIGTVLVAGARAPRLVTRAMVARMKRGAALVDLSIDQGGLSETSRPTSHRRPIYIAQGVVHYCVTNMPAIVPHTSTYALTNATLTYALELADRGVLEAGARNAALRNGVNTYGGHVVHPAVAAALRMKPLLAVGLVEPGAANPRSSSAPSAAATPAACTPSLDLRSSSASSTPRCARSCARTQRPRLARKLPTLKMFWVSASCWRA